MKSNALHSRSVTRERAAFSDSKSKHSQKGRMATKAKTLHRVYRVAQPSLTGDILQKQTHLFCTHACAVQHIVLYHTILQDSLIVSLTKGCKHLVFLFGRPEHLLFLYRNNSMTKN